MSERTIKVVKTDSGYQFVKDIAGPLPDNLDLYTLYFQLKNFEKGIATEAGIGVLKKFAKRYGTRVVIIEKPKPRPADKGVT